MLWVQNEDSMMLRYYYDVEYFLSLSRSSYNKNLTNSLKGHGWILQSRDVVGGGGGTMLYLDYGYRNGIFFIYFFFAFAS